jgi:hypothetical protein
METILKSLLPGFLQHLGFHHLVSFIALPRLWVGIYIEIGFDPGSMAQEFVHTRTNNGAFSPHHLHFPRTSMWTHKFYLQDLTTDNQLLLCIDNR